MNLKILRYPNPILRRRAQLVARISKDIFKLSDDMIETMLAEDGLGLAANQISALVRLFVVNMAYEKDKPEPVVMINPEILKQEGDVVAEEGCLSFPELYLKIARPARVVIHAKNLFNEDLVYETEGLLARAMLHEVDHLNGRLFIDRAEKGEAAKIHEYLDALKAPSRKK